MTFPTSFQSKTALRPPGNARAVLGRPVAMVRFSVGLALFLVLVRAFGEGIVPFRVGFSKSTFHDVNENDASAALRVWAQSVASERSIASEVRPIILRNTGEILAALTNKRVDAV